MPATPLRHALAAVLLCAAAGLAPIAAAQDSPVGRWRTIDDATGKPRSVVAIADEGDTLSGRIESLVRAPGEDPDPACDKCSGPRKGQPIRGMRILWDVRRNGAQWDGGRILDPESGKVYSVKLRLLDGGRRLEVRGYLGFSLLGRTQVWTRE